MSDKERNTDIAPLDTLLSFLEDTPNRLANLTEGLSTVEICLKQSADEFSALENICHLRDLELQAYTPRIKRMLSETNPPLPDFDGARLAAESNYNSQRPDLALQTFATARRGNVQMLTELTEEQLKREGTLEGVGKITLETLVELMREHDQGHLEDLRVLRQRLERQRSSDEVSQGGV